MKRSMPKKVRIIRCAGCRVFIVSGILKHLCSAASLLIAFGRMRTFPVGSFRIVPGWRHRSDNGSIAHALALESYLLIPMKKNVPAPATSAILPPVETPSPNGGSRRKSKNRLGDLPRSNTSDANGHSDAHFNEILRAITGLKKGQFATRLPLHWSGVSGKIADVFNDVAELMEQSTEDLSRISRVVGREGKLNERLSRSEAQGQWAHRIESVNTLIDSLVLPVSETGSASCRSRPARSESRRPRRCAEGDGTHRRAAPDPDQERSRSDLAAAGTGRIS